MCRGVIQWLIYLYKNDKACGNLYRSHNACCSIFVTESGEGRILPSLDPEKNMENDVSELLDAMNFVLKLAQNKCGIDTSSCWIDLPTELVNFFNFVGNIHKLVLIFLFFPLAYVIIPIVRSLYVKMG